MKRISWIFAIAMFAATASAQTNTFPSSGNVGIGTMSPGGALSIVKTGSSNGSLTVGTDTSANYATVSINYDSSTAQALVFNDINTNGRRWSIGSGIGTAAGFFGIYDQNRASTRLAVDTSGNVGIGTSTPGAQLDVEGGGLLEVGQFYLNSNVSAANTWQRFSLGYGAYWNSSSGNYTITDPTYNQSTFSNENGTFVWTAHAGTLTSPQTYAQWHANDKMVLTYTGNLGVGTISPGARLEVDGNIQLTAGSGSTLTFADGTIQGTAWTGALCGGDYAESVDVFGERARYEPGDILVIDEVHLGKFLKSTEPYSQGIAGVYSTKPGLIGRRQTTPKTLDEIPMGVVGILPVKVTTENGPIHPRDLLVASSKPGYAMKGTDQSKMLGAVIGKAMGSLSSGTGVIEVLVNVQ